MNPQRDVRIERDSFGEIEVPAECYWGAQTQRSLLHFGIGTDRFSSGLISALASIKKAAAWANGEIGRLDRPIVELIERAADEVIAGKLDEQFPLRVWQTGSGTQTNMNMNEVIANRANEIAGHGRGTLSPVHPNDHVNCGQSSNDVFPTAMHVAAGFAVNAKLLPVLDALHVQLLHHVESYRDVYKIGRTHLQDATPLTFGQEISGWAAQLSFGIDAIFRALPLVYEVALGGTAVGTGLNTTPRHSRLAIEKLAEWTGLPLRASSNTFAALAGHEPLVVLHSALKCVAVALNKIANDIRWLSSGPRCGLGEVQIPENEPGSSIMPGKINPTQCEALTMVCTQVMGNDTAVTMGAASGNFELNVFKPMIAYNVLHSIELLGDAVHHFTQYCVLGMKPVREKMADNVEQSLMLVTALSPHIGYENAARVAKHAHQQKMSLRDSAISLGLVKAEQYDRWVIVRDMANAVMDKTKNVDG